MVLELALILICIALIPLLVLRNKKRRKDGSLLHSSDNNGSRGRLPVLGYWETLKEFGFMVTCNRHLASYEWSYEIGKRRGHTIILKVPLSPRTTLNSNNLEFCKKVMSSSEWQERMYEPHYMHETTFGKPHGLLFGSGELKDKASRLTVKLLHQFEFFKPNKMENFISFEMSEIEADLSKRIEAAPGGALTFSPHTMFEAATLNVVCQVLFGKRYSAGDPVILDMLKKFNVANREFSAGYSIMEFIPWLKYFPKLTFLHSFMEASDVSYRLSEKVIKEKREELSPKLQEQAKDFVDAFLQEIEKQDDKLVAEEMLLVVLRDMLMAGSDTVNSTLEHGILHMSIHPNVQRKFQAEIDEVVGQSRAPVYNDKAKMPYTQAVLLETLRVASSVPATIRATKEATTWEGYPLEKGSQLGINLYGIHRSEELWDDPLTFRPERFLHEDGTLINTEKIMPFGYGKRACVGESVARATLFIFFVTLLQKFTFEISSDHPAPLLLNPKGLSRCPMPYFVVARKRGC